MGMLICHLVIAAVTFALFTGTLRIKVNTKMPRPRPSSSGNHPPFDF